MNEPRYADKWIGLGGRPTSLKIDHRVQMYVCSECAALVLDQKTHTDFHGKTQS